MGNCAPDVQRQLRTMARALRAGLRAAGLDARVAGDSDGSDQRVTTSLTLALRAGRYPGAPRQPSVLYPVVPRRESRNAAARVRNALQGATQAPWPTVLFRGALCVTAGEGESTPVPAIAVYLGEDLALPLDHQEAVVHGIARALVAHLGPDQGPAAPAAAEAPESPSTQLPRSAPGDLPLPVGGATAQAPEPVFGTTDGGTRTEDCAPAPPPSAGAAHTLQSAQPSAAAPRPETAEIAPAPSDDIAEPESPAPEAPPAAEPWSATPAERDGDVAADTVETEAAAEPANSAGRFSAIAQSTPAVDAAPESTSVIRDEQAETAPDSTALTPPTPALERGGGTTGADALAPVVAPAWPLSRTTPMEISTIRSPQAPHDAVTADTLQTPAADPLGGVDAPQPAPQNTEAEPAPEVAAESQDATAQPTAIAPLPPAVDAAPASASVTLDERADSAADSTAALPPRAEPAPEGVAPAVPAEQDGDLVADTTESASGVALATTDAPEGASRQATAGDLSPPAIAASPSSVLPDEQADSTAPAPAPQAPEHGDAGATTDALAPEAPPAADASLAAPADIPTAPTLRADDTLRAATPPATGPILLVDGAVGPLGAPEPAGTDATHAPPAPDRAFEPEDAVDAPAAAVLAGPASPGLPAAVTVDGLDVSATPPGTGGAPPAPSGGTAADTSSAAPGESATRPAVGGNAPAQGTAGAHSTDAAPLVPVAAPPGSPHGPRHAETQASLASADVAPAPEDGVDTDPGLSGPAPDGRPTPTPLTVDGPVGIAAAVAGTPSATDDASPAPAHGSAERDVLAPEASTAAQPSPAVPGGTLPFATPGAAQTGSVAPAAPSSPAVAADTDAAMDIPAPVGPSEPAPGASPTPLNANERQEGGPGAGTPAAPSGDPALIATEAYDSANGTHPGVTATDASSWTGEPGEGTEEPLVFAELSPARAMSSAQPAALPPSPMPPSPQARDGNPRDAEAVVAPGGAHDASPDSLDSSVPPGGGADRLDPAVGDALPAVDGGASTDRDHSAAGPAGTPPGPADVQPAPPARGGAAVSHPPVQPAHRVARAGRETEAAAPRPAAPHPGRGPATRAATVRGSVGTTVKAVTRVEAPPTPQRPSRAAKVGGGAAGTGKSTSARSQGGRNGAGTQEQKSGKERSVKSTECPGPGHPEGGGPR